MVESVQMWVKHLFTYHCVMIGGLLTQHWKLQLLLKENNLQVLCNYIFERAFTLTEISPHM